MSSHKKGMIRFYDSTGQRIWESKDSDVQRLFAKNTPRPKISDSYAETIDLLKRKMR